MTFPVPLKIILASQIEQKLGLKCKEKITLILIKDKKDFLTLFSQVKLYQD